MDIGNFFQSIGDKVSKIMVPNSILQDLMSIKIAIGLIAISLLISSLALLTLAISHGRLKKTQKITSDQILDHSQPPHD
ncbi:MAG: hypothetical protein ABSC04_10790 [Syntrophobacteraceae bacterium]